MKSINSIKLKKNSLYHRQKMDSTAWQCRHLKGTEIITKFDDDGRAYDIECCNLCGKELK